MNNNKNPYLRISPEFRRLCLPMTQSEYNALEQEIIRQDEAVEIKAWGNTILYDFEKYEICKKHGIPYKILGLFAPNTSEALLWLCKEQLKRSDLPFAMRRYLIGKRYLYEKMLGAHNAAVSVTPESRKGIPQETEPRFEETAYRTQERLGKEYFIVPLTVRRYGVIAAEIDNIYDTSPELAVKLLREEIKIPLNSIKSLSKLSVSELKTTAEYILKNKADLYAFKNSRNNIRAFASETEKGGEPKFSVKEMPEYDPDSEAASLTLTIPSWINAVNRVRNSENINMISQRARDRLAAELERLEETIYIMLDALREENK